jgi:hypothetical protein
MTYNLPAEFNKSITAFDSQMSVTHGQTFGRLFDFVSFTSLLNYSRLN